MSLAHIGVMWPTAVRSNKQSQDDCRPTEFGVIRPFAGAEGTGRARPNAGQATGEAPPRAGQDGPAATTGGARPPRARPRRRRAQGRPAATNGQWTPEEGQPRANPRPRFNQQMTEKGRSKDPQTQAVCGVPQTSERKHGSGVYYLYLGQSVKAHCLSLIGGN